MATEITYGGYSFPHPYPFVGLSESPIIVSGQVDYGQLNITLVGQFTGCGLTEVKEERDRLLNALSTGFQTLTVGNTGYSYVKPISVNFPDSQIHRSLPYQIDFEAYHEKDFSQFYGILDPIDVWTFSEQEGRIVSASHNVSARAVKHDSDSLLAARNFVNSRMNGYENLSLFLTGATAILESKSENVDRLSNSYSVNENWRVSTSRGLYDKADAIVRPQAQISYNAADSVSIRVQGTIEGGISGSATTGMFTTVEATEFAKNALANFKDDIEENLYGQLFRGPQDYSYDVDTGSNSINFSFSFNDPTDPRNQEVIHDYNISVDASKDRSSVDVSIQGVVKYNSTNDIFTGQSPETEIRFQKVDSGFSGISPFSIAQQGFEWFTGANLDYSDKPLKETFETFNIDKKPFDSEINYSYNFSNGVDFFSGLLRNAEVTISTEHPFLKYGVKQTTDNSFAAQPLYDTILKKSLSIRGLINDNVNIQDALDFASGWANQYNSGIIIENQYQTGSNSISINRSFVIE